MRRISRLLLVALALSVTVGTLTACNTMQGAGKDISNGGKDLSNAAERNK